MIHEKLLSNLIRIKSYSGEEANIRVFIGDWFDGKGIESFTQGENLIVHFEGKDRTKAFIFNSHMDTVSAGDRPWKYGAWNPTVVGKKLVGLGASDMKSGLTASMLLADHVAKRIAPPVDMWFTYVVKEEIDGSGTESFADWFKREGCARKYRDMAAIFTEPTGLVEIEHGHRGNLFIRAETFGDSGHASRPYLIKKHTVREMIRFADRLQEEAKGWQEEFKNGEFTPPTVGEMTSIQAGVAIKKKGGSLVIEAESPNKFPSICAATFDVRTTPGFHQVAWGRIKAVAKEMGVKVSPAANFAPAGYTDRSEKIVRVTQSVAGITKLTVSQGSADLGFLSAHGIKAVIFGPGENNQGHRVNEYCYPAQIPQAVDIYKAIVEAWAK